jgi:hypothetical protein
VQAAARGRLAVHGGVAGRQGVGSLGLQPPAVALEAIPDGISLAEKLNP